mmetsp:Transcript_1278/g.2236  ORF Transcript_1278/g.2236 Transcript_1278/m.2236 type:complete len:340 (+) Transcript_1278:152-1171(+)|eukprot:CAMPEP_0198211522 /NCGR_PEP_ID=MMETSP1445-20131203/24276_1 /TAXON_ID=36898 /ORGANISM="Pyramimonas sp., Strain CCMP2087" /LENGTH=339 /DNA_ID=CAMNT_0043885795 /DNA_START=123 /DNA_END=1142 /DNA_ORIENTATION=-
MPPALGRTIGVRTNMQIGVHLRANALRRVALRCSGFQMHFDNTRTQLGRHSCVRFKHTPRAGNAATSSVEPVQEEGTTSMVNDVLDKIKDSDSGMDLSEEDRAAVDILLDRLEEVGDKAPLDNPLLWGNYDVAYVSSGKSQRGNPAGGRFRGKLGKALFQTNILEQNLYSPDFVVNKVGFKLFGFIPGQVTLNGTVAPEPADQKLWVRAKFESPQLSFMGLPALRIGPKSSVVLGTQYLDETIRLGKGSRGSYFVFTRKEADSRVPAAAGAGWSAIFGLVAFVSLSAAILSRLLSPTTSTWVTAGAAVVALALGIVLRNGGIIADDDMDAPAITIPPAK